MKERPTFQGITTFNHHVCKCGHAKSNHEYKKGKLKSKLGCVGPCRGLFRAVSPECLCRKYLREDYMQGFPYLCMCGHNFYDHIESGSFDKIPAGRRCRSGAKLVFDNNCSCKAYRGGSVTGQEQLYPMRYQCRKSIVLIKNGRVVRRRCKNTSTKSFCRIHSK